MEIAREVTSEQDNKTATDKLKEILKQDKWYFNDTEIPESESNQNAYKLCSSVDGAKKHCPVRWKAIQKWFTYSRQVKPSLFELIDARHHFESRS